MPSTNEHRIENLENLQRKITFNINKNDINNQVKEELIKKSTKVELQGFRPGKAPFKMVEQMYGHKIFEEILEKHIQNNFLNIVKDKNIKLASYPKFNLNEEEDHSDQFSLTAVFEVYPEILFGDLSSQEIKKPIGEIVDTDIEKAINNLLSYKTLFVEDNNKEAQDYDKVTIDFTGTIDNKEFDGGSAKNYSIILGKGQMLPEFEKAIIGLKVNQSVTAKVTFPENYHASALQGKQAEFVITLKTIEAPQLPEINEEFIKSFGIKDGNIESFKSEIKKSLELDFIKRKKDKFRDNIYNALCNSTPILVPNEAVHEEIHNQMEIAKQNLKNQGYKEDQIKLTHEMFEKDAKYFVALKLLVQEYARVNNIFATDEEIKLTVEDLATNYQNKEEYIKWYYEDKKRIDTARAMTVENKIISHISNVAKIVDEQVTYDNVNTSD